MDRHARGIIGQPFLDDWMGTWGTRAYWGGSFLRLVVLFLNWESRVGQPFQAYVDPQHVLGSSINGLPEHIAQKDVVGRIMRLTR